MKGFLKKIIPSGKTIGVALSGGEDSVCLIDYLVSKKGLFNIEVVAVNVEHGIRGEESLKDTAFCKELCKSLGVKIKCFTVDVPSFAKEKGIGIEAAARQLRYDCFFKAIECGFCDVIATAHHKGDSAETILFNLLRGSSPSGISGIAENSFDGRIIRPLIGVDKQEITSYVQAHGLKYVIDSTNADNGYTRNYLRQRVIPAIKEKFPAAEDALLRFAAISRFDNEYLYSKAYESILLEGDRASIDCGLQYPIFARAAVIAFKYLGWQKDYDNSHIEALFELIGNQNGRMTDLGGNLYAIKEAGKVVIKKRQSIEELNVPYKTGSFDFDGQKITVERVDSLSLGDGALYFDGDKLPKTARFRLKQDGDKFTKFGGGTVSLKKYLTDKKIPADTKRRTVVLAAESRVYVVVGIEISKDVAVDSQTKNIIKISTQNNT